MGARDLFTNAITSVPTNAFSNLIKLQRLYVLAVLLGRMRTADTHTSDIHACVITSLAAGAFNGLTSLTKL